MQVPFAQVLGRFTQKKAPGELPLLGGLAFIVSFCRSLWYTCFAALPAHFIGKGVSTMSTLISYAFIICHSPQKSSVAQKVYKRALCPTSPSRLRRATSPKGRGFGIPPRFLYLFGELYDIIVLRLVPPNLPRMGEGGCCLMAYIFSFVLSVAANVASYYICKWLDGWLKGRKH